MAKRKRNATRPACGEPSTKQAKGNRTSGNELVKHALLDQYYAEKKTLRAYVLAKLPSTSHIRRKKIASIGVGQCTTDEAVLGRLLDNTIVACQVSSTVENKDASKLRWQQWVGFSQRGDESYVTLSDGLAGSMYSQTEIVDFVIWLLFSREKPNSWPKHLLCDGFRRFTGSRADTRPARDGIPGVYVAFPNHRVKALKERPWPELLMLLGKEGERLMIDLLVDCAIFEAVESGQGNLYQLSGVHIAELPALEAVAPGKATKSAVAGQRAVALRPSEIVFVRNRMMYARAALNARGLVHFGLRHIHVLNRFPHRKPDSEEDISKNDESVVHILMYMFPRQFGLHNVFTSVVDRQQTAQRFQDYTLREEEISKKYPKEKKRHVPKRLRGSLKHLVERLQVLHSRCSYASMLQHYCPVSPASPVATATTATQKRGHNKSQIPAITQQENQHDSIVELATPISSISAFCQAVLSKIIPDGFWGKDGVQEHNKKLFLKYVNHFIHLRRFESMNLHELAQGMKILDIEWLAPPNLGGQKTSQSDVNKRTEIFHEFLYYLIDSLVVPLIRSNFYVTESSVHRYRVFFFRHDVWRYVAEPAMATLKANMFEEVPLTSALQVLKSRELGFAQVRLLPKGSTMRPIMNLRRRMLAQDKKKLTPSINSVLLPVAHMLKLEKAQNPSLLGSAMFSVGDIYNRIKTFKSNLPAFSKLYFAKIDVQAAFDTIPQEAMLDLLATIPREERYKMLKHVEVQLLESCVSKTSKRWHTTAQAQDDRTPFLRLLETSLTTAGKKNTVFVDSLAARSMDKKSLLSLAKTHVEQNLVRIGKKFYRQRKGIPQGSVLSSTLCSYFYADLEKTKLGFLGQESLLLRLIDDFLLITTDRPKAERFVRVMHAGVPEYGVKVGVGKSLVNFEVSVGGTMVERVSGNGFPYCGLVIDTESLEVARGRDSGKDPVIFNSLTVEYGRTQGQNFKRKVLNAFKVQSHLVFYDTAHNSRQAVLANAYGAFVETATKMWAYARCLPKDKKPGLSLLVDTVTTLIDLAHILLTSKSRMARYPGYAGHGRV
ncbi:hypothetical protein OQA88_3721 [Cercophora sp. LCS_1]